VDLDEVTKDEDLKQKIRQQLERKGLSWENLTSKQQAQIVKGSKAAKKSIKKSMA